MGGLKWIEEKLQCHIEYVIWSGVTCSRASHLPVVLRTPASDQVFLLGALHLQLDSQGILWLLLANLISLIFQLLWFELLFPGSVLMWVPSALFLCQITVQNGKAQDLLDLGWGRGVSGLPNLDSLEPWFLTNPLGLQKRPYFYLVKG